jgi:protein-S-isoprenylcysteine O-methyltransferase Ste14
MTRHLPVLAVVAGWGLVTWGIASWVGWPTWPISAGLLLLVYGAVAVWAQVREVQASPEQGPRRVAEGGTR